MKNITILTLGLLLTQLSFAQNSFRFGLKGASNFGWLSGTDKTIENDGTSVGFAYGLMGEYAINSTYGLHAELLLSQINSKFNLTSEQSFVNDISNTKISSLNYKYTIQYLEIPISMKLNTKEIGNLVYYGNFGFSPGFALNARASITSGDIPQSIKDLDPTDYRVNDDEGDDFTLDNFDDKVFLFRFPLIIGGGVEYRMAGSTSLQAGVRFANTFTDMFVKDKTADAKNNYFAVSVGVLF
ncbi:MAG: porin family protein [Bacteroidia bacterium]|nr:porin family protein [Bacteroidia bacterium]